MDFNEALDMLWNKTPDRTRNKIKEVAARYFAMFDIEGSLVIAHFMAQISHESRMGQIRRESMKYSAQRIMEVFGVGVHSAAVTTAQARVLEYNEKALAERVYGLGNPKKAKELGNTQPGDGFKYRGNGFLQLTGRYNHARIGKMLDVDLEGHPDWLSDPAVSFGAACAEFKTLGCIPWAVKDDVVKVTKLVNGGRNGLSERKVWLRRWKEALDGVEAPIQLPRSAEVDKAPPLMGTRTAQVGTVTAGAGVVSLVAQVGDYASTFTDTITTVKDNGVQVVEAVRVVKPFLGLSLHTWMQVGIGASVATVIGAIAIMIYRYLKIRNEAR